MPLTIDEVLSDIPEAIAFVKSVISDIQALPPVAGRKPSDLTALASKVLAAVGPLADAIDAQVKS
jgi:hypothetical protein